MLLECMWRSNGETALLHQDAIELLKDDHTKMRQLLQEFEASTDGGIEMRRQLLQGITTELEAHITIETEIFYPAYRDAVTSQEDRKLFFEAHAVLHLVDLTLAELREANLDTEPYGAKAKVLKNLVEHHAAEEEKEMFPKARTALGVLALQELGSRMSVRKDEILLLEAWRSAADAFNEVRSTAVVA